MPTVLRVGKARVVIYPNDHSPPHVHVVDGNKHARISIRGVRPQLMEIEGFSASELRRILERIGEEQDVLNEQWSRIHGKQAIN